jgi:hypothetical protein
LNYADLTRYIEAKWHMPCGFDAAQKLSAFYACTPNPAVPKPICSQL